MTKLLIGAATFALIAASPATAQLGGLGGSLGGGLGGSLGGLGGSVGGTLGGTVSATRTASDVARQARIDARRAERAARRANLAQGNITGTAAIDGAASVTKPALAANGSASGRIDLDRSGLRTRGIVAATERGLRRVTKTATGVPVFVAARAIPAPTIVAPRVVVPYPVYNRSVYYGGNNVSFIAVGEVGGYMDRQYEDLRREMRGTGATVLRRGDDLIVQLPADVTFAFDKSDIQPRFVGTLTAIARTLDGYRATDVEIVGHTDAIGSEQYNLALSERRGRSVADFLVERSADPSRLVVEAMGESEPVASNASIAGRAANRRVEIVFHPRTA